MLHKILWFIIIITISPANLYCPAGVQPNKIKPSQNQETGFIKGILNPYQAMELLGGAQRFVVEDFVKYYHLNNPYIEKTPKIDTTTINLEQLPSPYNQIKNILPYNGIGFYVNAQWITQLFQHNIIQNALEIGSDYGLSTRHIASLMSQGGKLYAVDVWDNTTNEGYVDNRYEPFLSNVIHAGLWNIIIPIKDRSENTIQFFLADNILFDFIYIDGDHATDAVIRDITNSYPLLTPRGIIAGDDWLLKSVRAGVINFAQEHDLTIYAACNFWYFKKETGFTIKELYDAPPSAWTF